MRVHLNGRPVALATKLDPEPSLAASWAPDKTKPLDIAGLELQVLR